MARRTDTACSGLIALGTALLLSACSSSTDHREVTGSRAERALQEGHCPASIIDSRGRNAEREYRYGGKLDASESAQRRGRELDNCAAAAARGDARSVAVLAAYYRDTGQPGALVPALEGYVAAGSDRATLRNSATYLYRAYASGGQGVAADPAKAFRYLGVAVNNGATELELPYAQALMSRGLYEDALVRLDTLASSRDAETRCEATLSLARLYFGASARHENWNIGYYYWRQGLDLAQSPDWGSCARDNFVYGERYSYESERKRFVDSRISLMSAAQRQVIDEARRNPERGYPFVAALSFQRPAGAPQPGADSSPGSGSRTLGGWPGWQPLPPPVCASAPTSRQRDWSQVFEANARAVWSVESRNGNSVARGSAVAVGTRQLVTNCHVIEHPDNITLRQVGRTLTARLRAADRQGDRCILGVEEDIAPFVRNTRAYAGIRVGEDVAAIGTPKGLESSLSRGIVAQKRSRDGLQLLQTDAAISSGSSGGGLFDRHGNLVGITTFTISSGQSLNFAIAVDEFCR